MKTRVENRLAQVRKTRGVGASDLARRVHVSRQTIYAIEAGTYVPNTEVALNLARELEVTVGELFSLQPGSQNSPESLGRGSVERRRPGQRPARSDLPDRIPLDRRAGQRIALLYAGSRRHREASRPKRTAAPTWWCSAKDDASQKRLVLAGCDPATGLLSRMVEKLSGVEIVSAAASSKLALRVAARRQSPHRRIASGRSQDRRVQSALHS